MEWWLIGLGVIVVLVILNTDSARRGASAEKWPGWTAS